MIKIYSKDQINKIKESGKINYETHKYLESLIKPGVTTNYLDEKAYKFITENNATPSFLNFNGFPKSICTSINDEVVHGIPKDIILKEGDIISIDIGVYKDGFHSDSARTYKVGKVSKEKENLLKDTEKMLYIGLDEIKEGAHLGNIGYEISKYAHQKGYGVVEELVGHGVGEELHESPDVPNFGNKNTGLILKEGMVIAVEPMINLKTKEVMFHSDGWTVLTEDGMPSAHFEHTVAVTKDGYEILTGE